MRSQASFSPRCGANSAPSNPLVGFEGPLRDAGEKEGKEKGRKGRKGWEKASTANVFNGSFAPEAHI